MVFFVVEIEIIMVFNIGILKFNVIMGLYKEIVIIKFDKDVEVGLKGYKVVKVCC